MGVGHGPGAVGMPAPRAAVFLDRDGVIVEPVPDALLGTHESPYHPDDVTLVAGAAAAIRALHDAGFLLVGVSNQPAAAKGNATLGELRAVHERTVELLAGEGAALDDWRYCLHHPDATVAELAGPCSCRKPAPGMLLDAARTHGIDLAASWMVGDSDSDVSAGAAAGTRTVLVAHPRSVHRRSGAAATFTVSDLLSATSQIATRSWVSDDQG
jgi:D-glycero-D-manno-heptose 1,7-bisphosphate phosphatase